MALILFFDYNPNTHDTIRQLDAFPYHLDECWLAGKMDQMKGINIEGGEHRKRIANFPSCNKKFKFRYK